MQKTLKKIASTLFIFFLAIIFFTICTGYTRAESSNDDMVYLGGMPIGIVANSRYLIVEELINVNTTEGCYSPSLRAGVKVGDLITSINGQNVTNVCVLNKLIEENNLVILTINRGGEILNLSISPKFDINLQSKKIGIKLKNTVAGIGTMTFIKKDKSFGALGHQIVDELGYGDVYTNGKIYDCTINGYHRATKNKAGELCGKIDVNSKDIGNINSNKFCGIYGTIDKINSQKLIKVGNKNRVKTGLAYIYTTINENEPKLYEIQIIKAQKQSTPEEKSMVIRVTDPNLLSTTGGILQGMSGSPIIQDGCLIGAVTHVFTNDTRTGYGIYVDWMLKQLE